MPLACHGTNLQLNGKPKPQYLPFIHKPNVDSSSPLLEPPQRVYVRKERRDGSFCLVSSHLLSNHGLGIQSHRQGEPTKHSPGFHSTILSDAQRQKKFHSKASLKHKIVCFCCIYEAVLQCCRWYVYLLISSCMAL